MARHAPIPLPGADADEHSCTLWYIRRRLGRLDYGADRMVTLVTGLIGQHGFPPPLPYLRAKELVQDVSDKASWIRSAVDQWLFDFLPPEAGAALDAAARRQAADEMDARAANLQLGKPRTVQLGNGRSAQMIDGGRA